MHHLDMVNPAGEFIATSNNLLFSARWLCGYVKNVCRRMGVQVIDCSWGILDLPKKTLRTQLELARRVGMRKWNERERTGFCDAYRQDLQLGPNDFGKVEACLKDTNMETVGMTLYGIPRGAIQFANERGGVKPFLQRFAQSAVGVRFGRELVDFVAPGIPARTALAREHFEIRTSD